jgi:hypothetical protein
VTPVAVKTEVELAQMSPLASPPTEDYVAVLANGRRIDAKVAIVAWLLEVDIIGTSQEVEKIPCAQGLEFDRAQPTKFPASLALTLAGVYSETNSVAASGLREVSKNFGVRRSVGFAGSPHLLERARPN